MDTEKMTAALRKLKKTHETFTVSIGVAIGIILFAYFFSFAAFIDQVKPGVVAFQFVTTVVFIFCLIFIKKIGLFFTKLRYGEKEPYRSLLQNLSSADFEKDEQSLCQLLSTKLAGK